MTTKLEIPAELYDEYYAKFYTDGGCADHIYPSQQWLEESRRFDVADTFEKFRPVIGEMLSGLGLKDPSAADRMTTYIAFQERQGFESGVAWTHEKFVVTTKQEARRQSSVLHNMKTAGV